MNATDQHAKQQAIVVLQVVAIHLEHQDTVQSDKSRKSALIARRQMEGIAAHSIKYTPYEHHAHGGAQGR